MSTELEIVGVIFAVTAVGVVVFASALIAWVVVTAHLDKRRYHHQGLSEAQAQQNCRPYLDPITPAYYGLPPHNGTVATEPREEEDIAQ